MIVATANKRVAIGIVTFVCFFFIDRQTDDSLIFAGGGYNSVIVIWHFYDVWRFRNLFVTWLVSRSDINRQESPCLKTEMEQKKNQFSLLLLTSIFRFHADSQKKNNFFHSYHSHLRHQQTPLTAAALIMNWTQTQDLCVGFSVDTQTSVMKPDVVLPSS